MARKTLEHAANVAHKQSNEEAEGSQGRVLTSSKQLALPTVNPLDTPAMEQWMLEQSGLLKVRPPVQAAFSGDPFYHAIPFQSKWLHGLSLCCAAHLP